MLIFAATNKVSAALLELTPVVVVVIIICALLVMSACLPACATLLLMPALTFIQSHVVNVSQTWSSVSSVTWGWGVCWMPPWCFEGRPAWVRFMLCALNVFPNSSWVKSEQDLSTAFLFPPFLSLSSWVVIPPVDQQMGAFPHQTTAQLLYDWATFNNTKHGEELWCLCSQTLP